MFGNVRKFNLETVNWRVNFETESWRFKLDTRHEAQSSNAKREREREWKVQTGNAIRKDPCDLTGRSHWTKGFTVPFNTNRMMLNQ